MARGDRGRRGSSGEYVRATAMFKSDRDYLPKGAVFAYRGRASGEFRDRIVEVVQRAVAEDLDLAFALTQWKGDAYPVLSLAAVEPREDSGRRDRDKDRRPGRGKSRGRDEERKERRDRDEGNAPDESDEPDNDDDIDL